MVTGKLAFYLKDCYKRIPKEDIELRAQFLSTILEEPERYRNYTAPGQEALASLYRDTIQELEPLFYRLLPKEIS